MAKAASATWWAGASSASAPRRCRSSSYRRRSPPAAATGSRRGARCGARNAGRPDRPGRGRRRCARADRPRGRGCAPASGFAASPASRAWHDSSLAGRARSGSKRPGWAAQERARRHRDRPPCSPPGRCFLPSRRVFGGSGSKSCSVASLSASDGLTRSARHSLRASEFGRAVAGELPGGEVLLQQLVEEAHLIGPATSSSSTASWLPAFSRSSARAWQLRQRFVERHHHLLAVASPPQRSCMA
jgi:hypothetical protein